MLKVAADPLYRAFGPTPLAEHLESPRPPREGRDRRCMGV